MIQMSRSFVRFAFLIGCALLGACADSVSLEKEARLGAAYAAEINRQLPLVHDPQTSAFLNQLGDALAERADPTGRDYTFYLVDSSEINAFAVPGGHIYVNRGLIERADEAAELAGVLGHEIAHVTERHGLEQVERQRQGNLLLNLLYMILGREPGLLEQVAIQGGGAALFARYGRGLEREADRRAVETLIAAGYHPEGIATFFEELLREQRDAPHLVEQWFSSHPTSRERIANTRSLISTQELGEEGTLVRDTREYQRFRSRVEALGRAR
jgi:predicted Zn-dependent protease